MACVNTVLAHISLVVFHINAVFLSVEPKRAIVEANATAGEAAICLMRNILIIESSSNFFEIAAPVLDFKLVNLMPRAFRYIAKFGIAGF